MMILSAVGIVMVVDAHCWGGLSILSTIIPYNSFFMPMFVFISGYFFNCDRFVLNTYITNKIKKLVIPYYGWAFFFWIICRALNKYGVIYYDNISLLDLLGKVGNIGEPARICSSLWFVIALFFVCIVYAIVYQIFKNVWQDWIAFIMLTACGIYAVYYAQNTGVDLYNVLFYKVLFLLPFYEWGIVYKKYLEVLIDKIPNLLIIVSCLVVGAIQNHFYSYTGFNNISTMSGFVAGGPLMPFITTAIGLLFWLTISKILVPAIKDSMVVNFISNNTYTIMATHLMFFNVFSWIMVGCGKLGLHINIDIDALRQNPWYRYEPSTQMRLFYFMFGLFGSLLVAYILELIKKSKEVNSIISKIMLFEIKKKSDTDFKSIDENRNNKVK